MRTGVFGKLPAKRDFIALNLPHEFRGPWEDWMQASIAATRDQLGAAFQEQFLTAPLWRFWLGKSICGLAACGAFMPSVDGVGRYFPLSICACGEAGESVAPPASGSNNAWYGMVEDRLLSTLADNYEFDAEHLLGGLDLPCVTASTGEASPDALISRLFAEDMQNVVADQSWWWTVGGANFAPRVLRFHGLPDPYEFATFLKQTGAAAQEWSR